MFYRVGVKLPTVEVRYKNLGVEAECEVFHGKPLPTLWNATKSMLTVNINVFIYFSDLSAEITVWSLMLLVLSSYLCL